VNDLENLLILDGDIFPMDNGYWVKFEAKQIEPSEFIPHGIKYSLTLHDKFNQRVVGYDNAHGFRPRAGKHGAKKETWDHIHKKLDVHPYEFETAAQLIEDFWKSAEYYMENY